MYTKFRHFIHVFKMSSQLIQLKAKGDQESLIKTKEELWNGTDRFRKKMKRGWEK